MAHNFNIVAIRIQYKSPKIVGMILVTQARGPIIASTGGNCSRVEGLNLIALRCTERYMDSRCRRFSCVNPEIRLASPAEAGEFSMLLEKAIAYGFEYLFVKPLALLKGRDLDPDMINHRIILCEYQFSNEHDKRYAAHRRAQGVKAAPLAQQIFAKPRLGGIGPEQASIGRNDEEAGERKHCREKQCADQPG